MAMWASDKAFGIFTDFLNLGYSLANFDRKKAKEFRRRLFAPVSPSEMVRAINQSARDYITDRQNEDGKNNDRKTRKNRRVR